MDNDQLTQMLAHTVKDLTLDQPVADVLHKVARDASTAFAIAGAAVLLPDEWRRLFSVATLQEPIASVELIERRTGIGPCHEVYELRRPVRISDLREHSATWPELAGAAERTGLVAAAGVPLQVQGLTVGVLALYDTTRNEWEEPLMEAAQIVADTTARYLVCASAYSNATTVVARLQDALDNQVLVEQAKGVLANQRNMSVDDALDLLRSHAENNDVEVFAVAHAVMYLGLRPAPAPRVPDEEPAGLAVLEAARRALSDAGSPECVVSITIGLVHDLGGTVVPAASADVTAMPADLAMGEGPPLLATAPPLSLARLRLERLLPGFLEDARNMLHELRAATRRRHSRIDLASGLLTRAALGDDVDHMSGDRVLVVVRSEPGAEGQRTMARLLRSVADSGHALGHWQGRFFIAVAPVDQADGRSLQDAIEAQWQRWGNDTMLDISSACITGGGSADAAVATLVDSM